MQHTDYAVSDVRLLMIILKRYMVERGNSKK